MVDSRVVMFPLPERKPLTRVLDAFLDEREKTLSRRTAAKYGRLVSLWQRYLDHHGYCHLLPVEKVLWKRLRKAGTEITETFGAQLLVRSSVPFLGEYFLRKVGSDLELVEYAGTIVRKLARWLAQEGFVSSRAASLLWDVGNAARRQLVPAFLAQASINIQYDVWYEIPVYRARGELYEILPGILRFRVKNARVEVALPECVTEYCRPGWVFTLRLLPKEHTFGVVGCDNVNIFGWANTP
ncbi:hypothetical protein SAMN00808754_1770 [Thermanaeromonas toyohensis ToBE]|uniref:Core-binding (CB) domain-containing protein n=1 Tax=Thermanaeromonas toyohensis ToBE TaxID=698762 RepID=A0A1W1VW99_9FIRM|nr:hypothetical protein [Thermanaeromonas toyohensis]SMB97154.1 hypothetical protein SAMN00808754_1770 [Thermanaeromonas toyohensis ToBE]